jgi:hypothetical protein
MNTSLTTRSAALATCLGLFFAGATACGSNSATGQDRTDGASAARADSHPNAATSIDLIESAKAAQDRYLQQLLAERWNERKSHELQDKKRHHRTSTGQHPAGYNKAFIAEQ